MLRPHRPRLTVRTHRVAVAAAAVLAVDQATKALAPLMQHRAVLPMRNHDLLLGTVGGNRVCLTLLMATLLVGFGRHVISRVRTEALPPVGAGLLLGGALANLVDRAVLGSVRDFIVIGHAVVVNVADIAVAVGLVVYACAHLAGRRKTALAAVAGAAG
jgi:lipoprotein signal peptidase